MQTGAGSFYYLRNYQGSIAQLTDSSAGTDWTYAYEPFGATTSASKVDPTAPDNPLKFNGQYLDAGSGLYNLRARNYDAADGRFTATDPIAPALLDPYVSAYVYAGQQPTILADPSGMSACSIFERVCDAAGTVVGNTYIAGQLIVSATYDMVVSTAESGWGCYSGLIGGENRNLTRDCMKTALNAGMLFIPGGPGGRAALRMLEERAMLRAAKGADDAVETTGQLHHVISTRIGRAVERHPNLTGEYTRRDPRFVTRAVNEEAHRGYQTWHRELDAEFENWLLRNPSATKDAFEGQLRWRYSQTDLKWRFPNGF
jgi:RHS repeat-associated protein